MHGLDFENAKRDIRAAQEKAYYAVDPRNGEAPTEPGPQEKCGVYDPSLRAEAEKRFSYHAEEAAKQDKAAAFFRENPAFDQFIRLIRSGAIQI